MTRNYKFTISCQIGDDFGVQYSNSGASMALPRRSPGHRRGLNELAVTVLSVISRKRTEDVAARTGGRPALQSPTFGRRRTRALKRPQGRWRGPRPGRALDPSSGDDALPSAGRAWCRTPGRYERRSAFPPMIGVVAYRTRNAVSPSTSSTPSRPSSGPAAPNRCGGSS